MLFGQYRKLLAACHVPNFIIADLDYVREVGNESLRSLFSFSAQSFKKNVIDDVTSIDGKQLAESLDEAIRTGNIDELKPLWEYIKSRQSRLRAQLDESDRQALRSFIAKQRSEQRFILSRGSLEDYLPAGFKDKNIEKLIQLVNVPNFWDLLPTEIKPELEEIVSAIAEACDVYGSTTREVVTQ